MLLTCQDRGADCAVSSRWGLAGGAEKPLSTGPVPYPIAWVARPIICTVFLLRAEEQQGEVDALHLLYLLSSCPRELVDKIELCVL